MGNKPFSRMDLTPLVGVLLALFAMLIAVGLPSGEADAGDLNAPGCTLGPPPGSPLPPMAAVVSVQSGGIFVGQSRVTFLGLPEAVRAYPSSRRGVFVRADADVDYARVFAVYQRLEANGFAGRIGIINEDLE